MQLQKLQKVNAKKQIRTAHCMSVERIQNELEAGVLSSFCHVFNNKDMAQIMSF